jgi:hypothetical protein
MGEPCLGFVQVFGQREKNLVINQHKREREREREREKSWLGEEESARCQWCVGGVDDGDWFCLTGMCLVLPPTLLGRLCKR